MDSKINRWTPLKTSLLIMLLGIVIFLLAFPLDDGEGYRGMAIGALGAIVFLVGLAMLVSSLIFKYFLPDRYHGFPYMKVILGAIGVFMIFKIIIRNFTNSSLF